jgi:hypothetical protein
MALVSDILVRAVLDQSTALDLVTATAPLTLSQRHRLTSGTGTGAADVLFSDTRTLAASATEDLDLAGALASALGGSAVFAKLKAVLVTAAAGNTNAVNLTRPAANGVPLFLAAGDGLGIQPGGTFLWVAPGTGVTVTAATGDLITFTNAAAGTPVTYSVVLVGTSA